MIEDLKIITGHTKDVQAKAQAYLASHPKAKVLGTAITIQRGKPIDKPEPKAKPAAKSEGDETPASAAILRTVEYGPDVTIVSITLGKSFD